MAWFSSDRLRFLGVIAGASGADRSSEALDLVGVLDGLTSTVNNQNAVEK
jgi:hypothetical protein